MTCKNCAHNRGSWVTRNFSNSVWWTCDLAMTEPRFNRVDGKTTPGEYESCSAVRRNESLCGKEAKAWTPRRKKDLFLLLKRI